MHSGGSKTILMVVLRNMHYEVGELIKAQEEKGEFPIVPHLLRAGLAFRINVFKAFMLH